MLIRNRRLRVNSSIRSLVQETQLCVRDFIVPIFVIEGKDKKEEIFSMPNYFRISLDLLEQEILSLWELGLSSVLLFVKISDQLKDNSGTEAINHEGLMQRAIKKIKRIQPKMLVITDVALDPYSSFGHDGIVRNGKIINDETVEILTEIALSHAHAGADFLAPSDMMDGRIRAIREKLECNHFYDIGIISYSAKYASSFYEPFRNALGSSPGFGDKKTYQMDFHNSKEAIQETLLDIEEGADIVMVKPGMSYLDIVSILSKKVLCPVGVYQVSGEYAMIKSAAKKKWLNEQNAIFESLSSFKRAGAKLIVTYFAKDIAKILKFNL